jgi:hypothetical protein
LILSISSRFCRCSVSLAASNSRVWFSTLLGYRIVNVLINTLNPLACPRPPRGFPYCSSASACAAGGQAFSLHGRARHVAIGTEHTAVARLRTQHSATVPAVVEELSGARGHRLRLPVPTLWTGDGGCENGCHRPHSIVIIRKAGSTWQQPWPTSVQRWPRLPGASVSGRGCALATRHGGSRPA